MTVGHPFPTYEVLGVPVVATDLAGATDVILSWAKERGGGFVCLRDVPSLMAIKGSEELCRIHERASMVLPDGGPVALVGKLRGYNVKRTCGPDLLEEVCRKSVASGAKHFFFGGKDGVADKLVEELSRRFPGIQIVGTYCPPFRPLSEAERQHVVELIRNSGANIVWVGLSSPKQDVWMCDNYSEFRSVLIGVGAAFDFHAGEVKRAPVWMQRSMLEWLYRLWSEPRRLWRRYLLLAPQFVFEVILDSVRRKIVQKCD